MLRLTILALTVLTAGAATAQDCLQPDSLIALDTAWEQAMRDSDVDWFEANLADEFLWVHNHASSTDTKQILIARASDPDRGASGHPVSRTSSEVQTIVLGATAVVTGFTVVDHGDAAPRYNFMRTWVLRGDRCQLLANHTMQIPEDE